jgi:hypothetical protein
VSASGTELSGARRIFRAAIRGARQIDKFKKALAKDQRTTVSHLHKGLQYSRKRYPPIFMKTVKTSRFRKFEIWRKTKNLAVFLVYRLIFLIYKSVF